MPIETAWSDASATVTFRNLHLWRKTQRSLYSPVAQLGEPWQYSYNHWVESEKGRGTIDAYSSPGAFGFYPWITPDQRFYGILSRHDLRGGAALESVQCGRKIRKAFLAAL